MTWVITCQCQTTFLRHDCFFKNYAKTNFQFINFLWCLIGFLFACFSTTDSLIEIANCNSIILWLESLRFRVFNLLPFLCLLSTFQKNSNSRITIRKFLSNLLSLTFDFYVCGIFVNLMVGLVSVYCFFWMMPQHISLWLMLIIM